MNVDKKIIERLRESNLSKKMKSLEFCKFLVIEEDDDRIIGASGIGGLFNVHSLQIHEKFHGKGIGKELFKTTINEAQKRGYCYIFDSIDPNNIPVVKLVRYYGFKPLFRIHYSEKIVSEAGILILKKRGYIIYKICRIFNNSIGIFILSILIKLLKSRFFKKLLTYPPEEFPDPDIKYIIQHFEKI